MTSNNTHGAATVSTSGSLGEQFVNSVVSIHGRRSANGGGAEAVAIASTVVRTWNAENSAAFALVGESLGHQVKPGSEMEVERACKGIASGAFLTREAARDGIVKPNLESTQREMEGYRARGIARLRTDNAQASVEEIVRKVLDCVNLLVAKITGAIEPLYGAERLRSSIESAIEARSEGLATIIAAVERIRAHAETEAERIDRDLQESAAALEHEREFLRVVAIETKPSLFGGSHQLDKLITTVSTSVPRLGNARVPLIYLPLVRAGLPNVCRALDDCLDRLYKRRQEVIQAYDRLNAAAVEREKTDSASSRILVVGAPENQAGIDAEIERVVNAARSAVSKELRDLAAYKAVPTSILESMLETATSAVSKFSMPRSLDDVLLAGADPVSMALRLDAAIHEAALPLALTSNADRHFLSEVRCMVLRVSAGSRLPAILATHAGYRADAFCFEGSPDRLEVLVFQPGIDIENTTLFHAGRDAYECELADDSAPPVHVFSDSFLAGLVRKPNGKTGHVVDEQGSAEVS
jgi:hypothetical protein